MDDKRFGMHKKNSMNGYEASVKYLFSQQTADFAVAFEATGRDP